ncbi:ELWxxDGT repeat protein [Reichenbachiella sp.]|uniref:ELWxxDGT repeat protein n=1 Tax=Reichenbachiella sp. TaxID=2184521 RepID=UPI003BB1BDBE
MHKFFGAMIVLILPHLLYSQVQLVKDINTDPASVLEDNHYNDIFYECGDYLFFAVDNELGKELWKTDGTTNGTTLVLDLNKGHNDGILESFVCLDEILYFLGRDGKEHNQYLWDLWSTDGSVEGTHLIKKMDNNGANLFSDNNNVFGVRATTNNTLELWSSDGSEDGTQVFATISNGDSYIRVSESLAVNSQLFYVISTYVDEQFIYQLWTSNGTQEGTFKLLDSDSYISNMIGLAGQLHFVTKNESNYQLRKSDGTLEGTQLVTEMASHVQSFIPFGNQLVFTSGGNHWITDGTESGTKLLGTGRIYAGVVLEETFYGIGSDFSTNSSFLMSTDGTSLNTNKIADFGGYVSIFNKISTINNQLIFPIYSETNGEELGISDGTEEGTFLLKDIYVGPESSIPKSWANYNGKVLFLAKDETHGTELWSTDGTTEGTTFVKDILPGTKSINQFDHKLYIQEINNKVVFHGGSILESSIYESDGSFEGTNVVEDFSSNIHLLGNLKNSLIYFISNKFYEFNSDGYSMIDDYSSDISGFGLVQNDALVAGDKMYFMLGVNNYGYECWVTNGTIGSTKILKDINVGSGSGIETFDGGAINDQFIFSANNGSIGNEIWITDGTEENTKVLKDINSGSESSYPYSYESLGSELFFVADDGIHGRELWKTDGTASGTVLVSDIIESSEGSNPRFLTSFEQEIFFSAYNPTNGWSLWKTNGTEEGTILVTDINSENEDVDLSFTNLFVAGDNLYFTIDDGIHGNELWVSDGTSEGTQILEISEGAAGSFPDLLTEVGGLLYFKANNQIWRTDGTEIGTSLVADYHPLELVYLDGWIYFSANSKEYGVELFKVPFTKMDQVITFDPIPVKRIGDEDFALNAISDSGLDIQFSTKSDNVEIDENLAKIISYGSTTISAEQKGNEFYNGALVEQTFCINPNDPVISIKESNTTATILVSSNDKGNQWYLNGELLENGIEQSFYAYESGNYSVTTVSEDCLTATSDDISIVVTAISDSPSVNILVYPNPTSDHIQFQTEQLNIPFSVEILNVYGQIMDKIKISHNRWEHSVKSYPKGLYFINIEGNKNGFNYFKLLKN